MVTVKLKGVAKVTAKGRAYWYAWRGGPRLVGEPGSPEFHASYIEAHEALRAPDPGRFRSLVVAYRRSDQYEALAPVTQYKRGPWLDRIAEHFGSLSIAQFERPQKIRPIIIRWRANWADRPRTADQAIEVLSCVLAHAVDRGRLSGNPCHGIKPLYSVDRSEIVWTEADIAALKRTCSPEIAHAIDLAAHTGLRLRDLIRLSWSHVGDDAIIIATSKSRFRRSALIPLYDALRNVLAGIPKRSTVILTNSLGRPWTVNSLGTTFSAIKNAAGFADLHFHDLRGTAATRFYVAGLPERVIGEIMGWEEEHVAKIIRRYVDRTAATRAIISKLNERRS